MANAGKDTNGMSPVHPLDISAEDVFYRLAVCKSTESVYALHKILIPL
jgi:hypothetical protein